MHREFITVSDFKLVGVVTSSCNLTKLDIAINDAALFDLEGLLCFDLFNDILEKWRSLNSLKAERVDLSNKLRAKEIEQAFYDSEILRITEAEGTLSKYSELIEGTVYQGCSRKSKRHSGIRALWVYYAYSHYVKGNTLDDTPNGLVHKSNEFSLPVPLGEINTVATGYRNKAKIIFEGVQDFLCVNKDYFTKFDACDCHLDCGCSGSCGCGGSKKFRGVKFKTVRKNNGF